MARLSRSVERPCNPLGTLVSVKACRPAVEAFHICYTSLHEMLTIVQLY